ncbi:hypothetical protein [Paenibacillus dauci]|uniref:hypothetical protein n=1 Tax=Paenibacillus dauci TaxID=1567106 RepID=UPI0006196368|nr:hypothetical protein [Paenibacillus dauci]
MLFINKKLVNTPAEPYWQPDMVICYAKSQSLASVTNQAVLLLNTNKLVIIFLTLFTSKTAAVFEFATADVLNQKYNPSLGLSSTWSFDAGGQHWRFLINKVILPLGSMQADFLEFLQQNIVE